MAGGSLALLAGEPALLELWTVSVFAVQWCRLSWTTPTFGHRISSETEGEPGESGSTATKVRIDAGIILNPDIGGD
jgi:hypothetical protein